MTINEAIEILDNCMSETDKILFPERLEAHKLLIEAGKLIENLRFDGSPFYPSELPGETK